MTTEAQKDAMKRYYEKNRDKRKAEMSERAKARTEERRQFLLAHPEELKKEREKGVEKYYKTIENKQRRRIKEWLDDPKICPAFKAFLRENVMPVVDKGLPTKFLPMCWNYLAICVNTPAQNVIVEADGSQGQATKD